MSKYTWTTDERITKTIMDLMLYGNANGESADDLTKLAIKDQSGAGSFATQILIAETLGADRALTLALHDAARTIDLSGNLVLAGTLTTTGAITFAGAYTLGITLSGNTALTLPTTGTLATLAGSEALTNKTLTAPSITGGTAIELTSFSLRSAGGNDLIIASTAIYTADRTLTINIPPTANAALTLVGSLATAGGAFGLTLTMSATSNVTLPTTGTLATTDVATLSSLVSVGTIATGTWNATPVTVPYGGTGLSTLTDHGVLLGSGTGSVTPTVAGTEGQPLLSGGAAADPSWGTLGANYGGTGLTTITDHSVMLGSGTTAVTPLGVGATGTLLRGASGADPAWTTLTMPATIGVNEIFYASSANVLGVISAANSGILVTSAGGVPSIATDIPTAVTIGGAAITRVGGTDVTLADGGTNASLTAANGGIVWSSATALAILAAGSAGQALRSGGAATPAWTTATYPATVAAGNLLHASTANVITSLTAVAAGQVLISAGVSTAPAWSNAPTVTSINLAGTSNQLVLQSAGVTGTLTWTPATANKVITLPNFTGTVYVSSGTDVALADGGTNASLTADVGAIPYSSATAIALLAATATAGQIMRSGSNAAPTWSTATYPATVAAGDLLHASGANVIGGITAVAVGQVLCSAGASTAPAWSATPTFTSSVQTGRGEVGLLNLKDETEITLDANGEATVTQTDHSFDTNGDGASDALEAIIGGATGDRLIFHPNNAGRTIVAKHAGTPTTGAALNLAGGADFTMDEDDDFLTLKFDGTLWQEISRSENHA